MADQTNWIFPILITPVVVFVASAAVTGSNIGIHPDFVKRWLSAFLVGWPVAAVTAFIAIPPIRRLAGSLAALFDRKS
jgi:hypothetical protein